MSTNEELIVLRALTAMFEANLPAVYVRPVPNFFNQNRVDMLIHPNRVCMVDIGNTARYEPLPDHLNTVEGGLSMKTVTYRIYVFCNVVSIDNVNYTKDAIDSGVLDMEADVCDVLNAEPFLTLPGTVMRWQITSVDREAWKQIEPLIGATVTIEVEMGDRDRINP